MAGPKPLKPIFLKTLLTACALIFTCLSLTAQAPTAAFTPSVTSGCAILKVSFTDNSTNNPTLWHWDFGNGQTSSLQNPDVFFDPGTYDVTLIAENGNGASAAAHQTITVFGKPVVAFTPTTASGCFPLPVQFSDQSTTVSGNITKWEWDFGDGDTSSLQNPKHVYRGAGTFVASVKVTNSNGCSDFSKPAKVTINDGVKADYTNTVSQSCKPPAAVTFTNTSHEYGNVSYLWDFGDGSTDTRKDPPVHIYTDEKAYTVTLVASSDKGCIDTLVRGNQINIIASVKSDFTAPAASCSGVNTTLTNTSAPQPFTATWDFGDGTPAGSGVTTVAHSFANAGTYSVKLVNNFGTCLDSITKPVTIVTGAQVGFYTPDTLNCMVPVTVTFTDTTKGSPTTWLWSFEDGLSSTLQNPSHTYTRVGAFHVTLSVTNANNCNSSLTKRYYVSMAIPTAKITVNTADGCNTLDLKASAAVNAIDGVASYTWQFGDGTTDFVSTTTNLVTHHYASTGNFVLTLIVTTKKGCTTTATQKIQIGVKPTLVDFTVSDNNPCAGTSISFTDLSKPSPGIDRWRWDFGDGSSSGVQNPAYKYTEDNGGTAYNVKLVVFNNGCADSVTKSTLVKVKPPVAKFTAQINCNNKREFSFVNNSTAGSTVVWTFGDGTTGTSTGSFTHTYPNYNQVYPVTVKVTNGACVNVSDTAKLFTLSLDSTFKYSPASPVCRRVQMLFLSNNTNPPATKSYSWNYGDGTPPAITFGTGINKTFTNSGDNTVTLSIQDSNNCVSSTSQILHIKGLTPAFNSSKVRGCISDPIVFTNNTTGYDNATQWFWDMGDGNTYQQLNPPSPYAYAKQGSFNVKLTVSDGGCIDSLVNPIVITQPYTDFSVDTASCPGSTAQFLNTSTGNTLTYAWNFGDGGTSTLQNPAHTFATNITVPGSRTVTLRAKDANGCVRDTFHIMTFDKPSVSFTPTTGTTSCPPLAMDFVSTSHYAKTFDWNFDDGAHATSASPSHTYYYPNPTGYVVKLTITSPGGCTATYSSQPIKIFGPTGIFDFTPKAACTNSSISFSVTNANSVKNYTWIYGDGASDVSTAPTFSHLYATPGAYLPKVILADATNTTCFVPINAIDSLKIIGMTPAFSLSPAELCDGGTVIFKDSTTGTGTIKSYDWTFGDGTTGTGSNPSHIYAPITNALTSYTVSLKVTTQEAACTFNITSADAVKAYASPKVTVTGPAEACDNPAVLTFQGNIANAPNYTPLVWLWDFGNGNTSALQNPAAQTFPGAGAYSVVAQVTNSKGCVGKTTYPVTVHPLPSTNAGIDTIMCLGQPIQLLATGADGYNWLPPSNASLSCTNCADPIANPAKQTDFVVQGSNAFSCTRNDTVHVMVNLPVKVLVDPVKDSLCLGESVPLRAVGAALYTWTPATGLSSTTISNPVAKPDTAIVYTVVGTDSKSCFSDQATVTLSVFKYPTIDAGADASIPSGNSYQIAATGSADIVNYVWKPAESLSCNNCPNPIAAPVKTTTYTVTATNNGNCSVADNITVIVFCNDQNFFMPNTFSPNNDGSNDVYYPRGKGLANIQSFTIFNRWGQKVFERKNFAANDASAGWNGFISGEKAPQDVYTYIIEFVCANSMVVPFKGNVSLIR